MGINSVNSGSDWVICGTLKISTKQLVCLIAGIAIMGVSTTFMHLNSFNIKYWQHLLASNVVGGIVISTGLLFIIRRHFFSEEARLTYLTSSDLTPSATFLVSCPLLIRELFNANGQNSFADAKIRQENYAKIYEFAKWHNQNKDCFLEMRGDPLSKEYQQKMAEKLFKASSSIKHLPNGGAFERLKANLKVGFIKNSYCYFDSAFLEAVKNQERKAKKELFEKCVENISHLLTEKFSEDQNEKQFFLGHLQNHWNLMLFGFDDQTHYHG